jgi:hypothetical protein
MADQNNPVVWQNRIVGHANICFSYKDVAQQADPNPKTS